MNLSLVQWAHCLSINIELEWGNVDVVSFGSVTQNLESVLHSASASILPLVGSTILPRITPSYPREALRIAILSRAGARNSSSRWRSLLGDRRVPSWLSRAVMGLVSSFLANIGGI